MDIKEVDFAGSKENADTLCRAKRRCVIECAMNIILN